MGFIRNHHDVVSVRKRAARLGRRHELLNGRKEDAARNAPFEFFDQVFAAGGLFGRLAQDFGTARERAKELIVEVVAVGDDHDGGIFHGGMQDQPPRVKSHGETLARALRVPDRRRCGGRPFRRLSSLGLCIPPFNSLTAASFACEARMVSSTA